MKKLLLTSDGLSSRKIKKAFLKLLEKPVAETKVLIIHTLLKKSYIRYVREVKKELQKLGIPRKNIFYANISNNIKPSKFVSKNFDVLYSCGGNTFYILDRIRKTGFDKFIKNYIKKAKLYIGVSAGSIIVHKTIEIAGWGSEADSNDIHLNNLAGLTVTNIAVYPHYHASLKKEIIDFKKTAGYPIKEIKDGQAVLILGNRVRKI